MLKLYLEFPCTVRMGPLAERRRMDAGLAVSSCKKDKGIFMECLNGGRREGGIGRCCMMALDLWGNDLVMSYWIAGEPYDAADVKSLICHGLDGI